jgi:hypothetical protein
VARRRRHEKIGRYCWPSASASAWDWTPRLHSGENLQKSPHDAVLTHLGPEGEERSPLFSMAPLIFSKFYFARIPRIQRLAGHKIWKFIFWTLLGSLNSAEDSPFCHKFSFSERKFVIHSSKRHCV